MIGVYASDLRVGDVILGVGKVIVAPRQPDEWGEVKFTVKEDGQLYLIKVEADEWFRIEREDGVE